MKPQLRGSYFKSTLQSTKSPNQAVSGYGQRGGVPRLPMRPKVSLSSDKAWTTPKIAVKPLVR
jgi:hypothetical protein